MMPRWKWVFKMCYGAQHQSDVSNFKCSGVSIVVVFLGSYWVDCSDRSTCAQHERGLLSLPFECTKALPIARGAVAVTNCGHEI